MACCDGSCAARFIVVKKELVKFSSGGAVVFLFSHGVFFKPFWSCMALKCLASDRLLSVTVVSQAWLFQDFREHGYELLKDTVG